MTWKRKWFPHRRCQSAKHDGHQCTLTGKLYKMTKDNKFYTDTHHLALCKMHALRWRDEGFKRELLDSE